MRKKFAFALLAALILTAAWASASDSLSENLTASIVRLHILANSDTAADQALKLKVRDRLLAEARKKPAPLTEEEILSVCQDEAEKNGAAYPVSIERGRFYFPRKRYENITLPAGKYNAVRVLLGAGAGQNWWCVMYPPLCFTGAAGGADGPALKQLRQALRPETFSLLCEGDSITVKPSFKLMELWQQLKARFL